MKQGLEINANSHVLLIFGVKQGKLEREHNEVAEDDLNESCEGLSEGQCLMRRTLVAHTDYIYTQNLNP